MIISFIRNAIIVILFGGGVFIIPSRPPSANDRVEEVKIRPVARFDHA